MSKTIAISIPDFRNDDLNLYMIKYNRSNKSEVVAECIRIGLVHLNKEQIEKKGETNELYLCGGSTVD